MGSTHSLCDSIFFRFVVLYSSNGNDTCQKHKYSYSSFFIWITTQYMKRHSDLKPERKSIFIDAVLSYNE